MSLKPTSFYVQKPRDKYWNTPMPNWVVEAGPIDPSDPNLSSMEKTAKYLQKNLKVITPKDFGWSHIEKRDWVECKGPARKLEFQEYVDLYLSLKPETPIPRWQVTIIEQNQPLA